MINHKWQIRVVAFAGLLPVLFLLPVKQVHAGDTAGTIAPASAAEITRDIDYLAGVDYANNKDRLDIFIPQKAGPIPVLVYFHGGALRMGDKGDGEQVAQRLHELGLGVVLANYRLSPGVQHPAHIEDAASAFAWVYRHIAGYGGDPRNLYVGGHSAGAYLAILLSLDPSHLAAEGLDTGLIRGTIGISPFLYVEETARQRPKTVWGEDPAAWLKASVSPHITGGKNPALLIYADGDADWRKDQILRFTKTMQIVGNKVKAVEAVNRDHMTLVNSITASDDQVSGWIVEFIEDLENR